MDIDIDIEEHNILENPALKAIFPDITVLKQELDYENEAINANARSEFNLDAIRLIEQADNLCGNKITTSKSRKRCLNHNLRNEDLKLKMKSIVNIPDISFTLTNSKKFCNCCSILFPSITSFIHHKKNIHGQDVDNNLKTKNTTNILKHQIEDGPKEKNEIELETEDKTKQKKQSLESLSIVLCFHCKSTFPTKQNLIDHLYEVLEPKLNKQSEIQINNNKSLGIDASTSQNMDKNREPEFKTRSRKEATTTGHNNNRELLHQCHICSFYFKGEKYINDHMFNKHNTSSYTVKKVSFSPGCTFCSLTCSDIKSYNKHIYRKHKTEVMKNVNAEKLMSKAKKYYQRSKTKIIKESHSTSQIGKKIARYFQCHICWYYYKGENFYKQHMLHKHRIHNPSIEKVAFCANCKFCSLRYNNIKLYNEHLYKRHKEIVIRRLNVPKPKLIKRVDFITRVNNVSKNNNTLLPKSTLFRCSKCDMIFISPSMALNHMQHMEILINWKCGKCNLYFKRNDSAMHLLQHNLSEKFTILEISAELLEKILYSCPRCTIHFQENKFFDHYHVCENETPQSVHCRFCDILIDAEIKTSHQEYHIKRNWNDKDFLIIDLDIVENENPVKISNVKKKVAMKIKRNTALLQNYHMYCCNTCKCFVSKLHKVRIHKESRCTQIIRYPCKFCGLVLTEKCIMRHRQMHYDNNLLNLQDFTFYDLFSGKKICPPIPVLPKCESCNLHFIYKSEIRTHTCDKKATKICPFCEINLTKEAYEIHVPFHKYSMEKTLNTKDDLEKPSDLLAENTANAEKLEVTVKSSISVAYCCKICSLVVHTYDEVIEHCQMHLLSDVNQSVSHKNNVIERYEKVYNFDPFYYGSENDKWLNHLYGLVSNENINTVLMNAIYRYESRIKMEISQDGLPEFTEYKCGKCYRFIDCMLVYEHIDICIKNGKTFVCEVCTLPFLTKNSLEKHYQTHILHNATQDSFRIVTFNKTDHKHINKLIKLNACRPYVVYRCRNCEGLINKPHILRHKCNSKNLKKCSDCGLLLYNTDYDWHIKKHKQLESFKESNIKVILVGKKFLKPNEANVTKNTFLGVVCDYTFYKCSKCEVCIKDFRCISKHFCLVDSAKGKCRKCGLYFDEGKLKGHLKLHLNDPDFVKGNIFTESFDPIEHKQLSNIKKIKSKENSVGDEIPVEERREAKMYKCVKCNLHFLTENSVKEHIKKQPSKITKQNCTKCGFAFSSSTLFNHLLEHHGKKNIVYNFEVIDVKGSFKKQKIFKCQKCKLHFTNSKKMHDHYLKCEGDSTKGEKCKYCGVLFHFSYLICHEKMHENNMHVDYEVDTTEDEGC